MNNKQLRNIVYAILAVVGQIAQNVALPLWLSPFDFQNSNITSENSNNTLNGTQASQIDSYFAYTFSCGCFVIIFGIALLFEVILRPESRRGMTCNNSQVSLAFTGFCNGINGVLVVFSSSPERTAPYLQVILGNFMIPLTVFFRLILLRKSPTLIKSICAAAIFVSLMICMLPDVVPSLGGSGTSGGATGLSGILWPIIFMFGFAPVAIMYVVEEKLLKARAVGIEKQPINMLYFIFLNSLYQLLTAMAFFWADIIPWFGNTADLSHLITNWSFSLQCTFGGANCPSAPLVSSFIFIIAYCVSMIGGSMLIRHAEGATFVAVISALVTPLGFIFWTLFRAQPFGFYPQVTTKTGFALGSLVLMIPSIFFYNWRKTYLTKEDKMVLVNS